MSAEYPYPVKTSVLKGITSHKCIESKLQKQAIHGSVTGSKQRNKKTGARTSLVKEYGHPG